MRREVVVKGKGLAGSSDLTLIARIKPGFVNALESVTYKSRLKRLLRALHVGRQSSHEYALARPISDAVERIARIHSVRVVILEAEDRLLLSATFDGSWESYFRTLWQKTGRLLDAIYCNTEDYVTAWDHSYDEWAGWARRVQRETDFFYGLPSVTVDDQRLWRNHERQARRHEPPDAELRALRQPLKTVEQVASDVHGLGTDDPPPGDGEIVHTGRGEREVVKQGFQAIAGLYALTDVYPPGTLDGSCLGRAAVEFIGTLPDVLLTELGDPVLRRRFERQIRWFEAALAEPLPAGRQRRGPPTAAPVFDPRNVQGGIVSPYPSKPAITHGAMLLLAFDDRTAAASFLQHVLHSTTALVTTQADAEQAPVKRNIAFTLEGLRACGLDDDELTRFPDEFRHGMAARAGQIGDLRTNHPRRWPRPRRFGADPADADDRVDLAAVHVIAQLRVAAPTAAPEGEYDMAHPLHPLHGELRTLLTPGTRLLAAESTRRQFRPSGQVAEHFGWADGDSDPHVKPGEPDDRVMLVHLGELLLGHPNEADASPPPDLSPWLPDGSFVAVRKLRQHVDRLDAAVARVEPTHGAVALPDEETVRGKLMGRRRDGTPMLPGGTTITNNNFTFQFDPAGAACPLHAHIRRANPRETGAPLLAGRRRPRIARRSMSYGPPYRAGEPPETERGLLFVAYNASLGEQFEVIQRWLAGGNSTGAGSDVSDPLLGVPENGRRRHYRFEHDGNAFRVHLDGSDNLFEDPQPLVTLEWGLYGFAPSMAALRALQARAASAAVTPVWDAEAGARKVAELLALGDRDSAAAAVAWKQLLEDVESVRLFGAAGAWAALRERHGGLLRTPYGVLVTAPALVQQVLGDGQRFSVEGYRERMLRSIGENHLGLDDTGPGCPYRQRGSAVNAAISLLDEDAAFEAARQAVHDKFDRMVADATEKAQDDVRYEAGFDPREIVEDVLADLCERWFGFAEHGIADARTGEFRRGGFRWDWRPEEAPSYPGHFSAPSRYIFQPAPGPEVVRWGIAHGQAVQDAALRMVRRLRAQGLALTAPVGAAALGAARDEDAARDFAGSVMGMVPTLDGALRRVLSEWTGDGTLWLQRARRGGRRFADRADAELLDAPIARALQLRPMPELVWRVATGEHRLIDTSGRELALRRGETVVVALVSVLQSRLTGSDASLDTMFGGLHDGPNAPTHACPGRRAALSAMRGVLAAFVEHAGGMRPGATAQSLMLEGPIEGAAPAAAPRHFPPPAAAAATLMKHTSDFAEAAVPGEGGSIARAAPDALFGWGDSWLSYRVPFKGQSNLMRYLGDHGFAPIPASPFSESGMKLASMGARPADDMVYTTLDELLINGQKPYAIVLSASGNDCVKNALLQYVRDASTGTRIDTAAWQSHLRTLRGHAATVINNFREVIQRNGVQVPIVLHGYDHPVADGRFLLGLPSNAWLHGWLVKTLHYDVAGATSIMKDLIDGLNAMQKTLEASDVLHVDLSGTLRSTIGAAMSDAEWSGGGYKKAWENELHPTPEGFAALAAKLATELRARVP